MKILMRIKNGFFEVGIEPGVVMDDDLRPSQGDPVWFNDIAHLKLGEIEALGRAKGFQTLTGWPIVKLYEP